MGETGIERKLGAMSMNAVFAGALAGVLCLATMPACRAQLVTVEKMGPDLYVQVRMDTTGEATVVAWSRGGGYEPAPALAEVLHCQGAKPDGEGTGRIRCSKALTRDGLALEGVVDLAPIARRLNGSSGIELGVNLPRLGFESSSAPMTKDGSGARVNLTARFDAGIAPPPIQVQFGYRVDQLAGVYLPLIALALGLTLIAAIMSRAGLAPLARSAVLLGTIVWMGAASQLQADAPLRILLFESPLANFAALFVEFWPPLFSVAFGVALGSRLRAGQAQVGQAQGARFSEVVGSFAVIPLMLTSVVGALPSMTERDWAVSICWLSAAPTFVLLRRSWIRTRARARILELSGGEFRDRMSALAAKAGCPQIKVYISFSTRSQVANAFALPGRSIFLTAPLVRSLSKREVDAVAAHELSHMRHSNRGQWTALCIAMLLFDTRVRDLLLFWPSGLLVAMVLPTSMFFAALRGARKREFAADASAAALTGDPRAMISSLARIVRNNNQPLAMNSAAEWFSSHPSTPRRIQALAAAARLEPAEVETLCGSDDPGDSYEIPAEGTGGGAIFTPGWQKNNAGIYGWVVIFGGCGAGLLVAWLLDKFAGFGVVPILGGMVVGCALTKCLGATVMWANYARLRRKLEARLGVSGQLVGLALESQPRLYNGFRFSDAGLLRFENGRLCYRSERITIALNPADVVETGMVAASPSNWFREQPMVRFRYPGSGDVKAFILHPVDWLPTQRRLLRSIDQWRTTRTSPESTSIDGFTPITGKPFHNPTIALAVRGFLLPGGLTLVAAISTRWILGADWRYVGCALAVTACAHTFMLLPAFLYRPPLPHPEPAVPVDTN
jgi:Zn-dependent protease with chaperone function